MLDHFNDYIDAAITQQHRIMEQTDNTVALHRAQGSIYTLRKLKLLKDEVNN
jgi:hypothetical protein